MFSFVVRVVPTRHFRSFFSVFREEAAFPVFGGVIFWEQRLFFLRVIMTFTLFFSEACVKAEFVYEIVVTRDPPSPPLLFVEKVIEGAGGVFSFRVPWKRVLSADEFLAFNSIVRLPSFHYSFACPWRRHRPLSLCFYGVVSVPVPGPLPSCLEDRAKLARRTGS